MRRNPFDQALGLAAHRLQPTGRVVVHLHDDDPTDDELARDAQAKRLEAWRERKRAQAQAIGISFKALMRASRSSATER